MPTKLDMYARYANYLKGIYGGCMCIYVTHMKSLASTMRPGALLTNDVDNNDNDDSANANFWELERWPNKPKIHHHNPNFIYSKLNFMASFRLSMLHTLWVCLNFVFFSPYVKNTHFP